MGIRLNLVTMIDTIHVLEAQTRPPRGQTRSPDGLQALPHAKRRRPFEAQDTQDRRTPHKTVLAAYGELIFTSW